jgi:hypothetical protein
VNKVGAALLLALSGLLVACSGSSAPKAPPLPAVMNIKGDVSVSGPQNVQGSLSACVGVGKYADLRPGASATISNVRGKLLGVGKIILGVGTNVYQGQLDQCTFRYFIFTFKTEKKGYMLKVADQQPIPVNLQYLIANRGTVSWTLTPTTTTTLPSNPLAPKTTTTTAAKK